MRRCGSGEWCDRPARLLGWLCDEHAAKIHEHAPGKRKQSPDLERAEVERAALALADEVERSFRLSPHGARKAMGAAGDKELYQAAVFEAVALGWVAMEKTQLVPGRIEPPARQQPPQLVAS